MDVNALLAYARTLGDPLTLDAADANLPAPLRDLLASAPGRRLTLSAGADGLQLDAGTLTISGSCSAVWHVTGLGQVAVTAEKAEVRCTADDHVSATVTGHLPLTEPVRAPVTVTALPPETTVDRATARGWRIALAADARDVTPADLLRLGQTGPGPVIAEPTGLSVLARSAVLPASGFSATFYPGTAYDPWFTFEVGLPDLRWNAIPGVLAVDRIGLAGTVTPYSWALAVIGRFAIGAVPMQLAAGLTDRAVLSATLTPVGAASFPGLAALVAWLAGGTVGTDSGIAALGGDPAAVDAAISAVHVRFDGAARKLLLAEVVSVLTLGALHLDVAFRYPGDTITGSLHDGEPLALSAVTASLGLPASGLADATQITDAYFSATPGVGAYFADLTVDTTLAAGPLTLKRVFLRIEHAPATGVTGSLGGIFTLAGTWIDLLAAYGGPETGWQFTGRTEPGTELHIRDLLDDLHASFGAFDVPKPVESLALTDIVVEYGTGTGAFTFACTGSFTVADVPVSATVTIDVTPAGDGHDVVFGGDLVIGELSFGLAFEREHTGADIFVASYTHTGEARAVSLHDLVAGVSPAAARLVPSGLDIGLTDARLLYLKPASGPAVFALGLVVSAAVDLSRLPLIGDRLPAGERLAADALQILYTSAELTARQLKQLGMLLPPAAAPLPAGPLAAGVGITAELRAGPTRQDAVLAIPAAATAGSPSDPAEPSTSAKPTESAAPAGYWLDVHRQLGPVQINRIGLLYQSGALFVGLDAAITLGPLSLSLDGLCFGSPLTRFAPEFRLDGIGLAYASGPLTMSGALLRVPADQLAEGVAFQFDGTVRISAESLELAGLGSYAQFADGRPSLFVYAQLDTPLGGPPAFFVDGLMGGFGFNRALALPGPDEVTAFPLVALGTPAAPGSPPAAQDPGHILDVLEGRAPAVPGGTAKQWITPRPGAIWLALGVAFTSYELVRTRALLLADISEHLTLALLGSSVLRLPQAADSPRTYAYVELGLEAVLEPEDGRFGLTAILSPNSYVIAPECHLTGGFAVEVWFGDNPHAGDFVLTLGGYHPAFPVPAHFPTVPRLGFRWTVSDTVTISGSAYAALTASCFMAGGRLEAVFQDGGLRAWFTVEADFLVSWRPFFFSGHFALSIGVSYAFSILGIHKTLSVAVGAGLDLWGPPTGGTVTVSLWVVSFTVAFGAPRSPQADSALTWPQFRDLLPAGKGAVVVQAAGELHGTLPAGTGGAAAGTDVWVVRATGFAFRTRSALPVSDLRYGAAAASAHDHHADPIDIKPMNLTGVTSVHRIVVRRGDTASAPLDIADWTLTPATAAVPDSLWGKPPEEFSQVPARPAAEVLADRCVGYDVRTPAPKLGATRGTVPASALADDHVARAEMPLRAGAPTGRFRPTPDQGSITEIGGIAAAAGRRAQLFEQLKAATGFAGPNGPLDRLAAQAGRLYSDAPMREGDRAR